MLGTVCVGVRIGAEGSPYVGKQIGREISRSYDATIGVLDTAGNVIETHEHTAISKSGKFLILDWGCSSVERNSSLCTQFPIQCRSSAQSFWTAGFAPCKGGASFGASQTKFSVA